MQKKNIEVISKSKAIVTRHARAKAKRQLRKEVARLNNAFTLIEILVVIGIIAVLAAIVLVAVNPARQFKLARDSQRQSNVSAILNAIEQNMSEHRGVFTCNDNPVQIPNAYTVIASSTSYVGGFNIANCLVPDYIASLPFDPSQYNAYYNDTDDYNTGYEVFRDAAGRITASSTGELTDTIAVTR